VSKSSYAFLPEMEPAPELVEWVPFAKTNLCFINYAVSRSFSPIVLRSIHNSQHPYFLSERNAENLYTCAAERIHKGTYFPKKTTRFFFNERCTLPIPFPHPSPNLKNPVNRGPSFIVSPDRACPELVEWVPIKVHTNIRRKNV
jgi:hypothetical protein